MHCNGPLPQVIHFHVLNEIYEAMLDKKETDEQLPENTMDLERKPGKNVTVSVIEPSMAADFTVSMALMQNNTLSN
jgi:hypothetical protein